MPHGSSRRPDTNRSGTDWSRRRQRGRHGRCTEKDASSTKELRDTYLEHIAKYVPTEIVAFFVFANSILTQSLAQRGTLAGFSVMSIALVVLFGAWLITPIYIWWVSKPGEVWILNAIMATALFPFWPYVVEGVGTAAFLPFDGHLASIMLGAASVMSGMVAPREANAQAGVGLPRRPTTERAAARARKNESGLRSNSRCVKGPE